MAQQGLGLLGSPSSGFLKVQFSLWPIRRESLSSSPIQFQNVCDRRALARMMSVMKAEIIKRESIKPSSPTPHHLRSYKLSLLDMFTPAIYAPIVLFYPMHGDADRQAKAHERSQRLKKSLSEVLTCFYPLAGKIKDHMSIDCNDDGADYLEARVNCSLSDILTQPEDEELKQFLPIDSESSEAGTGRVLLVQASFFDCGGMAIGVCISHKIADAATLNTFIKSWAATALESGDAEHPIFIKESLLPPGDFSNLFPPADQFVKSKVVTRRYVFDAYNIATLKAKAASASVQQPTRVETVSALIWKCAMTASRANLGSVRPSLLVHLVDIRKRTVPPLPKNSIGNLYGLIAAQTEENEIELHALVGQLRKGKTEFLDNYAKKLGAGKGFIAASCESIKELGEKFKSGDRDVYSITSTCGFPLFEGDFGWGKPTWARIGNWDNNNHAVLMDKRGGDGIEAWVKLDEEKMAVFERDQELLEFASLNPSALD